ncbi:MAG: hypothetical protein KKF48_04025 [Nanoarchaeota archaeon]|nr:hypothetical protein [Nanoarchaeota archaeon]MBU1028186.1 hypothetical protein [Nanoarchaeota archaeon]
MAKLKQAPVGVKILSILYYVGAGIFVVAGLFLIFFGIVALASPGFVAAPESIPFPEGFPDVVGSFPLFIGLASLVLGIFFILMAVLEFFIARGLWKGQNWARILVLIFTALGIILAISSIVKGNFINFLNLIISGFIGWYLLYVSKVKKFFK